MKILFRIICSSLLIFFGVKLLIPYELYPIEHFEFKLLQIFPFNWKMVSIFSRLIIGSLFAIAFLLLFYWKKIKWIKFLSLLMFPIPFIINPVFPNDYKDNKIDIKENPIFNSNFISNDKIQIYASSKCLHCKEAIKKLQVAKELSVDFPEIIIISYNSKLSGFLKENEIEIPLDTISTRLFIEITGGVFPIFELIKNEKVIKKWNNTDFNYAVLDNLSK